MTTRLLHGQQPKPLSTLRCNVTYCSLNTNGQCYMPHAVVIGPGMRCVLGQEMAIKAQQADGLKKGMK